MISWTSTNDKLFERVYKENEKAINRLGEGMCNTGIKLNMHNEYFLNVTSEK